MISDGIFYMMPICISLAPRLYHKQATLQTRSNFQSRMSRVSDAPNSINFAMLLVLVGIKIVAGSIHSFFLSTLRTFTLKVAFESTFADTFF